MKGVRSDLDAGEIWGFEIVALNSGRRRLKMSCLAVTRIVLGFLCFTSFQPYVGCVKPYLLLAAFIQLIFV